MSRPSISPVVAAPVLLAAFLTACVPVPPIPVKHAPPQPPVAGRPAPIGLLLLARDGDPLSNRALTALRKASEKIAPSALAPGLANPGSIQRAINSLAARRVRRILAVPLFAEPENELVMQTRFVLGLGPTLSADMIIVLKNDPRYQTTLFLSRTSSPVPVEWADPVGEDAPLQAEILAERAGRLSRDPSTETLLIVGRGSGIDALDASSRIALARFTELLRTRLGFAGAYAATLRFDAPPAARARAAASIRKIVVRASSGGRAIVLLDAVCDDGMDWRVRSALKGLSYAFDPRPLSSSPALRRWVLALARRADG